MKSMVRQLIAVTFGLCLSMLFSICSFASTGYPWFQVPNNSKVSVVRIVWYDSQTNSYTANGSVSDSGIVYISLPSNFSSTYSSQYGVRLSVFVPNKGAAYYGITISDGNIKCIDSNPGSSINGATVCWAAKGTGSNSKYSLQSTYVTPSSAPRFGQIAIYKPSGDGGNNLTASDFPLTFKISSYAGQFNYAGIPDDGVYNATEINSNKANSAIDLATHALEVANYAVDETVSIRSYITESETNITEWLQWIAYNIGTVRQNADEGTTVTFGSLTRTLPQYRHYTFTISNEKPQMSYVVRTGTLLGIITRKWTELFDYFKCLFDVIWEWWYPLKSSTPQYWNVYNTDTDSTELVNPSTVTYYITWYLGQLFLMNNEDTPLGGLQDSVDDIKDQLVTVENQEQSIITSIRTGIDNFAPDLSQIGSFQALSWCSNYLQKIYVNLGTYGTVILIGLLLGVCMQFIGYFRYK